VSHHKYRPQFFQALCQKIRILVCPIHCHVLHYHHPHIRPTMSCFTALSVNPALSAVIALTYLFIHCNFVACCWLLRIFRRTGADDYSADHDDYNRRGDDDCRYRYALCSPASLICTKNKNLLSQTDRATRCVRQDLAYCCITL